MKIRAPIRAAARSAIVSMMIALTALASGRSSAHPGGLNAERCHNNRKTGEYHCHRVAPGSNQTQQAIGQSGPRRIESSPQNAIGARTPDGAGQCFTGPRGGTYTITPSGRKNYRGC